MVKIVLNNMGSFFLIKNKKTFALPTNMVTILYLASHALQSSVLHSFDVSCMNIDLSKHPTRKVVNTKDYDQVKLLNLIGQ